MPQTELHRACKTGNMANISALLATEDGRAMVAVAAAFQDRGWRPIHYAARNDRAEVVKALVDVGASVEERDVTGRTPLHVAAVKGHAAVIHVLLSSGADGVSLDSWGRTPLDLAAYRGHVDAMRALLAAGVDVNFRSSNGRTCLQCAAEGGREDSLRVLIEAGADLDVQDDTGSCALHWAAHNRHASCVELLVVAGANVSSFVHENREGAKKNNMQQEAFDALVRSVRAQTLSQRALFVATESTRHTIELVRALSKDAKSLFGAAPADIAQCVASFVVGRDSALVWTALSNLERERRDKSALESASTARPAFAFGAPVAQRTFSFATSASETGSRILSPAAARSVTVFDNSTTSDAQKSAGEFSFRSSPTPATIPSNFNFLPAAPTSPVVAITPSSLVFGATTWPASDAACAFRAPTASVSPAPSPHHQSKQ